jgi:hypothetical protein
MRLSTSFVALIVVATCTAFLVIYSLQLHHDYGALCSKYDELQTRYERLSS